MDDRHSRHRLFGPIGDAGQEKIADARVAIVGCGALGSHSAELLTRAGIGRGSRGLLRLIDRDYVELSNLQRQGLYTEEDAGKARPKATAAARHLLAIDSIVHCEPFVRELHPRNALELLEGVHLIIDGTDNFRTRFLINDTAIALEIPWIYGGAIASRGTVATIVPTLTPCFRCFMHEQPPLGSAESCDTSGIVTPLPAMVAALQVTAALRWIVARETDRGILMFDLWKNDESFTRRMEAALPDPSCRSCGLRELPALYEDQEEVVTLCGRNSVQISSAVHADLDSAARRFTESGRSIHRHSQSLTTEIAEGRLTLFEDGRIVVEGTTDPLEARSIIARYLGA